MWEWFAFAPPRSGFRQWRSEYSAKLLAQAWCGPEHAVRPRPSMPAAMADVLDSRPETSGYRPVIAVPECITQLDEFRGEHRNHDLVVTGLTATGLRTLVAVEAKAKEPFGRTTVASELIQASSKSKVPARISWMGKALFGREIVASGGLKPGEQVVGNLRYQLLYAACGTLIEARRRFCEQAVLLIHQFAPATPGKSWNACLDANADALNALASALGLTSPVTPGVVVGPFKAKAGAHVPEDIPLFIGKVQTPIPTGA
jgi:hypothetical protein